MSSELFEAAAKGDNDKILNLLSKGYNINTKDPINGSLPIDRAVNFGHYTTFILLISKGSNLSKLPVPFTNTMFYAVYGGNIDIITQVNKLGIPYDIRFSQTTLMHVAASRGHIKVMEFLNSVGLSYEPISATPGYSLPLDNAIKYKQYDVVEFLLKKGFPTQHLSRINIISGAIKNKDEKLLDLFLNKYSLLKIKDKKDFSSLWAKAVAVGHIDILEKLNHSDELFKKQDGQGKTLMHIAAQTSRVDAMQWLYKKGLAFDTQDKFGETPSKILLKRLGLYDFMVNTEFLKGLTLPPQEKKELTTDPEKEILRQQIAKLQQEKNKDSEQIKYLLKENEYLQNATQQMQQQTTGSTNGPTKKRLHEEDQEDEIKIPRMS